MAVVAVAVGVVQRSDGDDGEKFGVGEWFCLTDWEVFMAEKYLILQQAQPKQVGINPPHPTLDVVQLIDAVLQEAHTLFQREYRRQLEMWKAYNGRYPYYNYEFAGVAAQTKAALPAAIRAYLG